VTGRRILAIPGVLALVFATTIGVGITSAGATKYPPPTFPHGLHCGHDHGFGRGGFTEYINIFGDGFHGKPSIVSNEGGTKFVVIHDYGNELVVEVTIAFGTPKGTHVLNITNPDHTSCKLHYTSR
jgi:hypothetical protein